jgi:hypothetical protein
MCAIVAIILAGIDYRFAGPDWKPATWPYYALPGLQIACIIFSFVIVFLGYITFTKPNIGLTIFYSIFLLLSCLFNIAIGTFACIGASTGFVNTYFGCNGKFSGIMEVWQGVDSYLQQVDQGLCGPDCPCYISNTVPFTTNPTVFPIYNRWTKSADSSAAVNFQQCSAQVQRTAYVNAVNNDKLFDPTTNFDATKFSNYMGRMENQFQCSGWCNVTYANTNTGQVDAMFKYLFSDVNMGPPQNFGCLNKFIEWLPPYLMAYGAITLLLAGLQLVVFVLALCQCCARSRDHEHQIPHHHDDNRK